MAEKPDEKQIQSAVERALYSYKQNISITIDNIAANLTEAFVKNYLTLEELAARIELRTRFLENTPEYFSQLNYNRNSNHYYNVTQVREFAQLRVILEENSKRLIEKLQEIHLQHEKLLNLIFKPAPSSPPPSSPPSSSSSSSSSVPDNNTIFEIASEKNIVQVEPDVERRKPLFDLHSKLVKQVKATDSLEGFKTLMKRNPAVSATSQQAPFKRFARNKRELERRYADSLYFFAPSPKGVKRKLSSRMSVQSRTSCEQQKTKMSKSMPKNIIQTGTTSAPLSKVHVKTSSKRMLPTNQSRSSRLQLQIMGDKRNHLKCYDLLDDLDGNTLAPIKSEYPRRDNIVSAGGGSNATNNEPKSYLQQMLKTKDDKVWKKLLNPTEPPPQKKINSRNTNSSTHNKMKSLMEYLTAPKHRITAAGPKTVTVLMVRVYYDNFPTKEEPVTVGAVAAVELSEKKNVEGEVRSLPMTPRSVKPSHPLRRKKVMLDHLRGLKARNDSIQKNIQKAIDVIETKMIDLLSNPPSGDKNNTEAFNVMEKEIMNVLDMMSDDDDEDGDKKITATTPLPNKNEKTKKIEKIMEPEKDNNNNHHHHQGGEKSVRLQRGITIIKNTNNDISVNKQPTKVVKPKMCEKKAEKPKIIMPNAKLEEFKLRILEEKKRHDEKTRKAAADIEDGERILGQVDNVIKNIDSIYTKLHETETAAVASVQIERKTSENTKKPKLNESETAAAGSVQIERKTSENTRKPKINDTETASSGQIERKPSENTRKPKLNESETAASVQIERKTSENTRKPKLNESETVAGPVQIERKTSENTRKQQIIRSKVKIMVDNVDETKLIPQSGEKTETKRISVTAINKSPSTTIEKNNKKRIEEPEAVVVVIEPEKIIEQVETITNKKIDEEKLIKPPEVVEETIPDKKQVTTPAPAKIPQETPLLADENQVIDKEKEEEKEESKVNDEIFYKKYENVMKKFQEARIYSLNYNRLSISIYYPDNNKSEEIINKEEEEELTTTITNYDDDDNNNNRNENILNTFYSIFFSSIFIAFNTNFVC